METRTPVTFDVCHNIRSAITCIRPEIQTFALVKTLLRSGTSAANYQHCTEMWMSSRSTNMEDCIAKRRIKICTKVVPIGRSSTDVI